jgi:hypothetical protein
MEETREKAEEIRREALAEDIVDVCEEDASLQIGAAGSEFTHGEMSERGLRPFGLVVEPRASDNVHSCSLED